MVGETNNKMSSSLNNPMLLRTNNHNNIMRLLSRGTIPPLPLCSGIMALSRCNNGNVDGFNDETSRRERLLHILSRVEEIILSSDSTLDNTSNDDSDESHRENDDDDNEEEEEATSTSQFHYQ